MSLGGDVPECFKSAVPFLIASVVYHIDWLKEHLPETHSFFNSRFYRDGVIQRKRFDEKVEGGEFYCEKTKMQATGIPPNINVLRELAVVKESVEEASCVVEERVACLESKLEEVYERVEEHVKKLPADLTQELLQHFSVNGALPLTETNLANLEERLAERIRSLIDERVNGIGDGATAGADAEDNGSGGSGGGTAPLAPSSIQTHLFMWSNGKMKRAPEAFKFPLCSAKLMWDAWWYGEAVREIGPFRYFDQSDMKDKKCKVNLSRAKSVMDAVTEKAKAKGLLGMGGEKVQHTVARLSRRVCDEVFDDAFTTLVRELENVVNDDGEGEPPRKRRRTLRRSAEAQCNTVYTLLNDAVKKGW